MKRLPRPSLIAFAIAMTFGVAALLCAAPAGAQTPTSTPRPSTSAGGPASGPTDAEVLAVEHQLLCPLCVNERLDVCTLAICADMKQIVRQRLADGATSEEIIQFFEARYGPKVRADLPRRGFNLLLFGWVGGALLATALAAALALRSMRRATAARAGAAAPDERNLDVLIAEATSEEHAETLREEDSR